MRDRNVAVQGQAVEDRKRSRAQEARTRKSVLEMELGKVTGNITRELVIGEIGRLTAIIEYFEQ